MLRQRIITAVGIVMVTLAVVFLLPSWGMALAFALLWLLGAWEWSAFGRWPQPGRFLFVGLVALLLAAAGLLGVHEPLTRWILAVTLLWWLLALVWVTRYPTGITSSLVVVCGLLILVPAWLALRHLHGQPNGPALVFGLLLIVWAADVGAYFAGRNFGKHKLAPRVSPKKTWEGVAGGLLLATLVSILAALSLGVDVERLAAVGLVASALSVVGDLTVSMFKRNADLKDSGNILPGHGGVMDRIDSLSAAAPAFCAGLLITEVIGP